MGVLKRILINSITCSSHSMLPLIIAGVEGYPVQDVKISNLFFQQVGGGDAAMAAIRPPANERKYPDPNMFGSLPATGVFVRHAKNIEFSRIEVTTVNPDVRPGVLLHDVDGFDASSNYRAAG